ncbi:hypothetical protein [Pendulispora albinea]|uniref:Lipoprotein n=1 Tax=Pendulispora albinea TaxID=2741071 RepID=A0ABZ2MBB4_9BACT
MRKWFALGCMSLVAACSADIDQSVGAELSSEDSSALAGFPADAFNPDPTGHTILTKEDVRNLIQPGEDHGHIGVFSIYARKRTCGPSGCGPWKDVKTIRFEPRDPQSPYRADIPIPSHGVGVVWMWKGTGGKEVSEMSLRTDHGKEGRVSVYCRLAGDHADPYLQYGVAGCAPSIGTSYARPTSVDGVAGEHDLAWSGGGLVPGYGSKDRIHLLGVTDTLQVAIVSPVVASAIPVVEKSVECTGTQHRQIRVGNECDPIDTAMPPAQYDFKYDIIPGPGTEKRIYVTSPDGYPDIYRNILQSGWGAVLLPLTSEEQRHTIKSGGQFETRYTVQKQADGIRFRFEGAFTPPGGGFCRSTWWEASCATVAPENL